MHIMQYTSPPGFAAGLYESDLRPKVTSENVDVHAATQSAPTPNDQRVKLSTAQENTTPPMRVHPKPEVDTA